MKRKFFVLCALSFFFASISSADDISSAQLKKLIAEDMVPTYIGEKGQFSYDPKFKMLLITGDRVRLRSQPNTKSYVIAQADREMWGSIDYLGTWKHPDGTSWNIGLYDDWRNYPEPTAEDEKAVVFVSAQFSKGATNGEYQAYIAANAIGGADAEDDGEAYDAPLITTKLSDGDFAELCATASSKTVESAIKSGAFITDRAIIAAACSNPDEKVIQLLIDFGANPNAEQFVQTGEFGQIWGPLLAGSPTGYRWKPIHMAAMKNPNPKVFDILLKNGAKLEKDSRGVAPIQYAASYNPNPKMTLEIIKHTSLSLYDKNYDMGVDPLRYAAINNKNEDVVMAVYEYYQKSSLASKMDADYFTDVLAALVRNEFPSIKLAKILLSRKADANGITSEFKIVFTMKSGWADSAQVNFTILEAAAKHTSNPEIIELLLNNGAEVSTYVMEFARENRALAGTNVMRQLVQKARASGNL